MKRIMIGAASSGSGKTTVTLGLLRALMKRNLRVQPFKVGPDYIDTNYHEAITGVASRNLDSYLINDSVVLRSLFIENSEGADISFIEGVMGLYDGLGTDKDCCSSASIAKQLQCPVLLVIDGKAISTSAAAIVKGFCELDHEVMIAGVIVNRVASETHYQLIKKSIERYTDVPVLGYLPNTPDISLPSRHLGLVPDVEMQDLESKWDLLAGLIDKHIDLDKLLAISEQPSLQGESKSYYPDFSDVRVAYAHDKAFHFYYQDNLDLMKKCGVTLIPFSPLEDESLPECDVLYIGGGFPEMFAKQLADNKSMKLAIKQYHQQQKPIYAECGGLMYIGNTLHVEEEQYSMVGIFQGESKMTKRLRSFGYCTATMVEDTVLGKQGMTIRGHEFHHSVFESNHPTCFQMEKKRDGEIVSTWSGGYCEGNTLASYLHIHFYQNPSLLYRLLEIGRSKKCK
ncbi:cobyrinate a,c-diamide synthase [Bacillus massiliigorillae]|uniref:cobyrinate a,c-diamide synthase n=1 Tax=Bacillus massiliigorillae TaxID=1243664 RepID=UPI00039C4332|nr:cobyrinate a,c-diamide synthase [Bacillus massiliigorillae]